MKCLFLFFTIFIVFSCSLVITAISVCLNYVEFCTKKSRLTRIIAALGSTTTATVVVVVVITVFFAPGLLLLLLFVVQLQIGRSDTTLTG